MRRLTLGAMAGVLFLGLFGCRGESEPGPVDAAAVDGPTTTNTKTIPETTTVTSTGTVTSPPTTTLTSTAMTTTTPTLTATSTSVSTDPRFPKAPGKFIEDGNYTVGGACAGKTVAQVLLDMSALQAGLATRIYSGGIGMDGSFAYPFLKADGGYAVAFKNGSGDCPAGCIDNEYWYFDTTAACAPTAVGHYSAKYTSPGNCYTVVGTAMWGLPNPVSASVVCNADLSPQDLNGTYKIRGKGQSIACTAAAGNEPMVTVDRVLEVTIVQAGGDLAKATVTITGTGHAAIDGQPLAATVSRRSFKVTRNTSNLPSTCPDESSLSITFDFEGSAPNQLSFNERKNLACPGTDYCKGMLSLQLTREN